MKRILNVGHSGDDVAYAQRLLAGRNVFEVVWYTGELDGDFGPATKDAVVRCKLELGYPAKKLIGNFGTQLERYLKGLDPLPLAYRRRRAKRAKATPKLVEPKQGFRSLDPSLHEAYSIVISTIGGYDLGTYNPASRLPGGGLSDHAVAPAMAFDIGFRPWSGWWNPLARRGFWKAVAHPKVEYVILGDKIHSKDRGLRPYTAGGHLNHVHVSGHR